MNNAWLIRPLPHGINRIVEFKTQNIVAVGWPGIGDLSNKSRADLKSLLASAPYNLQGLALGNAYATIDIFVNQIEIGDLVLCPDGDDIYFGVITSDYKFESSCDTDSLGFSHQRSIEWHSNKARTALSKELRSSLKVHRTTANLSRHFEEIEALCLGLKKTAPSTSPKVIPITYPLRPDFTISFNVPKDMTATEADRLSKYISTLYFTQS